jgi:hypothetical protein
MLGNKDKSKKRSLNKSKQQSKKRNTKTRQRKRKASKKTRKNKIIRFRPKRQHYKKINQHGGGFNDEEKAALKLKLRDIGFVDDSEINSYVEQLGRAAQVFSNDNFTQLLSQIDAFAANRNTGTIQQFKYWLENEYSKLEDDVETDDEFDE